LIEHPAIMTRATIPAEQRARIEIGDSLVRLSEGVEDVKDLRADLEEALAAMRATSASVFPTAEPRASTDVP
jgi:cystathionine gamma-lyase